MCFKDGVPNPPTKPPIILPTPHVNRNGGGKGRVSSVPQRWRTASALSSSCSSATRTCGKNQAQIIMNEAPPVWHSGQETDWRLRISGCQRNGKQLTASARRTLGVRPHWCGTCGTGTTAHLCRPRRTARWNPARHTCGSTIRCVHVCSRHRACMRTTGRYKCSD